MKTRNRLLVSCVLVSFAQVLAAPAVLAQDVPAASSPGGIGDIVVTAQRRKENLQRVAVAVSAVSASDLLQANVHDATRLGELVPGLDISAMGIANVIFLRGVGSFVNSPVADAAVATNYDGVYTGRAASGFSYYDLERVEVLKGPQGTLYGRNATGGAINIIPARPKLDDLSGYVTASFGNYNDLRAEGAINIPIGTKSALRISGSEVSRDGYLSDGTSDDHSQSARVQFLSEPAPNLKLRISGDYSHQGGAGVGSSYLGSFQPGAGGGYTFVPANLPISDGLFTPEAQAYRESTFIAPSGRFNSAATAYPKQNNNFYGVNAELEYDTGAGTISFIPAWRGADIDRTSSTATFEVFSLEHIDQFSAELRFASNRTGIFEYMAGGYFYNEKIDSTLIVSAAALLSAPTQEFNTTSLAPFGRVTAHLSDKLRFVGGVRYTHDQKSFNEHLVQGLVICPSGSCPNAVFFSPYVQNLNNLPVPFPAQGQAVVPGIGGTIVTRSDLFTQLGLTNQRVTWRAAFEYDAGPASLLYASVETGYRSGGFSGAVGFETFQPETITAYTLGSKNRFLDNRLQLNIEAFYWAYRNQQVSFTGVDAAGNIGAQVRNIGSTNIYGMEVESQFLLTPTTLVHVNAQYLNTKSNFTYQSPSPPPPVTGCAITPDTNQTLVDVTCNGKPSFNSPKWTLNLGVQKTIDLGDQKLVLNADTQFKSSRYGEFSYTNQVLLPSVWRSNAQIAYMPKNERWSIAAYVLNIEGTRTPTWLAIAPLTNYLAAITSAPRTYGVRASIKY